MLDVDGMRLAVLPFAEVEGSVGLKESLHDGCGKKLVPVGVMGRKPVGGGVHDDLFFGVGLLVPGIELGAVARMRAEVRIEQQRPERGASGIDDGRCRSVDVYVAVPFTQDVGGLADAPAVSYTHLTLPT